MRRSKIIRDPLLCSVIRARQKARHCYCLMPGCFQKMNVERLFPAVVVPSGRILLPCECEGSLALADATWCHQYNTLYNLIIRTTLILRWFCGPVRMHCQCKVGYRIPSSHETPSFLSASN